jgi:hypothetical protein
MEKLLIFILCTSSISWIVVKSKLFRSFREYITSQRIYAEKYYPKWFAAIWQYFDDLFSCVGCFGVYSGLISAFLLYRTFSIEMIAYSLSGAVISLLIMKLVNK